jgi:transcriptional regulator with XRE-family HTH domain
MAASSAGDAIAAVGRRLRAGREAAGLSLAELARRSGVARATLTSLEAGEGNPTLETVYALANALGLPISALIGEPDVASVTVVRATEGTVLRGDVVEGRLVERYELPRHVCEVFALKLHPGAEQTSGAHPAGVREHLLVTRGRARVGPASAPVALGPGDFAAYDASTPHVFVALGGRTADAVLFTVSPRA